MRRLFSSCLLASLRSLALFPIRSLWLLFLRQVSLALRAGDLVSHPVQAHGVVLPLHLFLLIQDGARRFLPFLVLGVPQAPSTPAFLLATAPGNC